MLSMSGVHITPRMLCILQILQDIFLDPATQATREIRWADLSTVGSV